MSLEIKDCDHSVLLAPTEKDYLDAYTHPQSVSKMVVMEICIECSKKIDKLEGFYEF